MQDQDIGLDASFEEAFGKTIDLGNRIAEGDNKADLWDVADGLLAGALQFWLYSRNRAERRNAKTVCPSRRRRAACLNSTS